MGTSFKLQNGLLLLSTEAPGGVYNAEQLKKLAALCDGEDAVAKATEDQRLALFVPPSKAAAVAAQLKSVGLGVRHYQDGLHQPINCLGALCGEHLQDAMGTSMDLADELAGVLVDQPLKIGINGCARCCLATHTLDISIIGDTGGYRVSLGGKNSQLPEMASFMAEGVPAAKLPKLIAKVVSVYKELAQPGESLQEVMERAGTRQFIATLAPYSQDAASDPFGDSPSVEEPSLAEATADIPTDDAQDGLSADLAEDDLKIDDLPSDGGFAAPGIDAGISSEGIDAEPSFDDTDLSMSALDAGPEAIDDLGDTELSLPDDLAIDEELGSSELAGAELSADDLATDELTDELAVGDLVTDELTDELAVGDLVTDELTDDLSAGDLATDELTDDLAVGDLATDELTDDLTSDDLGDLTSDDLTADDLALDSLPEDALDEPSTAAPLATEAEEQQAFEAGLAAEPSEELPLADSDDDLDGLSLDSLSDDGLEDSIELSADDNAFAVDSLPTASADLEDEFAPESLSTTAAKVDMGEEALAVDDLASADVLALDADLEEESLMAPPAPAPKPAAAPAPKPAAATVPKPLAGASAPIPPPAPAGPAVAEDDMAADEIAEADADAFEEKLNASIAEEGSLPEVEDLNSSDRLAAMELVASGAGGDEDLGSDNHVQDDFDEEDLTLESLETLDDGSGDEILEASDEVTENSDDGDLALADDPGLDADLASLETPAKQVTPMASKEAPRAVPSTKTFEFTGLDITAEGKIALQFASGAALELDPRTMGLTTRRELKLAGKSVILVPRKGGINVEVDGVSIFVPGAQAAA